MGSDGQKESCAGWGSRDSEERCHGNQFWDAICYNWLCRQQLWLYYSRGGFSGVKLSDEDIAEIECQSFVAMATNFGTKIGINWLCVDDSD